jgi:hypothetical protein
MLVITKHADLERDCTDQRWSEALFLKDYYNFFKPHFWLRGYEIPSKEWLSSDCTVK